MKFNEELCLAGSLDNGLNAFELYPGLLYACIYIYERQIHNNTVHLMKGFSHTQCVCVKTTMAAPALELNCDVTPTWNVAKTGE